MFILDRLLIGSLQFVLDKIAIAADRELNDEDALRDRLLTAQMRLELGEITEAAFREVEQMVVERLRAIREERQGPPSGGRVRGATVEMFEQEE